MGKDKKITLVLSFLLLVTLVVCLVLLGYKLKPTYTDVILVKDAVDSNRIISDKLELKNNKNESLNLAVETPEGLLNPDEVFIENPNNVLEGSQPSKEDRRVTTSTGNLDAKPLDLYELGTVIETLEIKVEKESEKEKKAELIKLLNSAKKERNKGRVSSSTIYYQNKYRLSVDLRELNTNGILVVYFTLSDSQSLETLKEMLPLYEKYKDTIPFFFVNNSFEGYDSLDEINEVFEEQGIPLDLPLYYDTYSQFFMFSEISSINFGYALLNIDFYVYDYKQNTEIGSTIELEQMFLENEKFKLEDERIIKEYEENAIKSEVVTENKDS